MKTIENYKMLKKLFIGFVCIIGLVGCARTAPVITPQNTIASQSSTEQIKAAIIEAGQKRNWVMTSISPGIIDGRYTSRGHGAQIRVNYNSSGYSINYVASNNLHAANGKIHRNYNRWVNNLAHDIQLRLAINSAN